MSEQPDVKPCPVCGAPAYVDETDADLFIGCSVSHCIIGGTYTNDAAGRSLAIKEWNRLHQAMSLLTAVEELSHRLDSKVGRSILIWKIQYGDTWELEVSISDGAFVRGSATLPDALIALAGQVQP